MREIKFKAWDKRTKQLIILTGFKYVGKSKIQLFYFDEDGNITYCICEIKYIILMQYTGLMDKNGKEIYEEDIVKFEDTGEDGYEYKEGFDFINSAVVVWNNGRFELDNIISDNSAVLEDMNGSHEDFWIDFRYFEVIGNIYENPELIESEVEA